MLTSIPGQEYHPPTVGCISCEFMHRSALIGHMGNLGLVKRSAEKGGARMAKSAAVRWLYVLLFLVNATLVFGQNDRSIMLGFYVGDKTGNPALEKAGIFPLDVFPQLAGWRERWPKAGLNSAAFSLDAVLSLTGLSTVEIMGFYEKAWSDPRNRVLDYFVSPGGLGWHLTSRPKTVSRESISLALEISAFSGIPLLDAGHKEDSFRQIQKAYTQEKPDRVDRQDVVLPFDEPVFLVAPFGDKLLIGFMAWTAVRTPAVLAKPAPPAEPRAISDAAAPVPVSLAVPVYPDELRHIQGEVGLRLSLDAEGNVTSAQIERPLHPYLDYAASSALRQSKFVPVRVSGKPVPVVFSFSCLFDPQRETSRAQEGISASFPDANAKTVLDRCQAYLDRWLASAAFYLCMETIRDRHRFLAPTDKPTLLKLRQEYDEKTYAQGYLRAEEMTTYRVNFAERMESLRSRNEYQILGKNRLLQERRVPVESDKRRREKSPGAAEIKQFSALNPFLLANRLIGRESWTSYNYRLAGHERAMGTQADIIEVKPIDPRSGFVEEARIWIGRKDGEILRFEIIGIPFEGYDDVWREAAAFGLVPRSRMEFEFGVVHEGIRYPSRTNVLIQYMLPIGLLDKISTELSYGKYKYFAVETEHRLR